MQNVMFMGRLAANPEIARFAEGRSKAIFRLLQNRGTDRDGKPRVIGVNCVSWNHGLNEKVIAGGIDQGCAVVVIGRFVDNQWEGQDGSKKFGKELVVDKLDIVDWAKRPQELAA